MLTTDNILKFKNNQDQYKVLIMANADFECVLKLISTCLLHEDSQCTQQGCFA